MNAKKLDKVIEAHLKAMEDMAVGSEEYKAAAITLGQLIDRRNEMKRISVEALEKKKRLEADNTFREKQLLANNVNEAKKLESEKKTRIWNNAIGIAGIVVPTILTIWGTVVSLKFEETGTVTTAMGRGYINKLLPKK